MALAAPQGGLDDDDDDEEVRCPSDARRKTANVG